MRDIILRTGISEVIAKLVIAAPAESSFTRNASWTLSNFLKGQPSSDFQYVRFCIPALTKVLIENNSEEILNDIVWGFSHYTDQNVDEVLEAVVSSNSLPRLIQLL